jgi:tryptophan-rich sensory protein
MNRKRKTWMVLAGLVATCLGVGALGSWAATLAPSDWYFTLAKPAWTPPTWVFAPVWTVLYALMAVAAWLVWRKDARFSGVRVALILFAAQLLLNGLWPFLFFGLQSPGAALIGIALLWLTLGLALYAFLNLSRMAGLLLVPYLLWTSYSVLLNFAVWRLN